MAGSSAGAALTPVQVGEALDSGTSVTWAVPAEGWSVVTGPEFTHDGEDGLRTPGLGHGQSAELKGTIEGPGMLRGWRKVSSELSHDRLQLLIDGTVVEEWSGEAEGAFEVTVPRGPHAIRWVWVKDSSRIGGLDAAWLDRVVFSEETVGVAEALDVTGTPSQGLVDFSTAGGAPGWRGVAEAGAKGGMGLFSSQGNAGAPCLLQAAVSGPAVVSFRTRPTETGLGSSSRLFTVTPQGAGCVLDELASGDWRVWRVLMPEAAGTLVLEHAGSSSSGGATSGYWVDDWSVTPLPPVSVAEALDASGTNFTADWGFVSGGTVLNPAWLAVEGAAGLGRAGGDVLLAQKPALPGYSREESSGRQLTTRVTGPGRVSFWCKMAGGQAPYSVNLYGAVIDPSGLGGDLFYPLKPPSRQEWQQRVIEVPAGLRDVRISWSAGWEVLALDEWVWTPTPLVMPAPTAEEAVDLSGGLTLTQTGHWTGLARDQAGLGDDDALTSVPPAAGVANTPLQATVSGEGWLSFAWQSGGQGGMNYNVDGAAVGYWNEFYLPGWERPDLEWRQWARRLPAGAHTIQWSPSGGAESLPAGTVRLDGLSFQAQAPAWVAALDEDAAFTDWRMRGAVWQVAADTAHDGVDALRSPPLTAGAKAGLLTRVTGPGTVRFWWKLEDPDPLPDLNGQVQRNILEFGGAGPLTAGTGGWEEKAVELPGARLYDLTWIFRRSDRATLPGDGAMLDQVRFIPAVATTVAEAMDAPALTWTGADVLPLGGGGFGEAAGGDLVRIPRTSNALEEGGWIEVALPGPGIVSVRTPVQAGGSRFRVDGTLVPAFAQEGRLWITVEGAGPHQCRFQFDPNILYLDLDDFQFAPKAMVPLAAALDHPAVTSLALSALPGGSFALSDAVASHDGGDVLLLLAQGYPSPRTPVLTLRFNGRARVRFWLRAEGPGHGRIEFGQGTTSSELSSHFGWQEKTLIFTSQGTNTCTLTVQCGGVLPYQVWVDQLVVEPLEEAPLAEALHAAPLVFTAGGSVEWLGWSPAGTAPVMGDGGYAEVHLPGDTLLPAWLETQVTGPGWLRYGVTGNWQTVVETTLQSTLATGSPLFIPPGLQTVRWSARQQYSPGFVSVLPSAELRDVVFEPAPSVNEALDAPGYSFTTEAEAGSYWFGSAMTAADSRIFSGDDVLKLTGTGSLRFPVTGPGWLRFEAGWPVKTGPFTVWPADTGVTLHLLPPPPAAAPDPLPPPDFSYLRGNSWTSDVFKSAEVWVPPGTWQAFFQGRHAATLNQIQFQPTLADPALAAREALNLTPETGLSLHPAEVAVTLAPVSHDGESALQLATTQAGALVPLVTFTVEGPALLTGWLRMALLRPYDDPFLPGTPVPGEAAHDAITQVRVLVDGIPWALAWGEAGADGWRACRLPLTGTGSHAVSFALQTPAGEIPHMLQMDEFAISPLQGTPPATALDAPGLTWTTGGTAPWQGFASVLASPDGEDAAWVAVPASQAVPPALDPPSWVQTTLQGPGMFRYAVQAGGKLEVQMGEETLTTQTSYNAQSGAEGWQSDNLVVPPGLQTVRFAANPQAGNTGLFGLDQIRWEPGSPATLAEAMDAAALTFSTGGAEPSAWQALAVPGASHDGQDGVFCLAPLTGATTLETTVSGPAMVSFHYWWGYGPTFSFTVDGVPVREDPAQFGGGVGGVVVINNGGVAAAPPPPVSTPAPEVTGYWMREEFEIAAGSHTLRWELGVNQAVSRLPGPLLVLDELALAPVTAGPSLAEALGQPGWTVTTNRPDKVRTYSITPSEWNAAAAVLVSGDRYTSNPTTPEHWPTLTAVVPGPGVLRYRWRRFGGSMEVPRLHLAGGTTAAWEGFASEPWLEGWIVIPTTGPVPVSWSIRGDGQGYWIDSLTFDAGLPPGMAAGAPGLVWTAGGTQPWVGIPGTDSGYQTQPAQAVVAAFGPSRSWLEAAVTGPGRLRFTTEFLSSFYWKAGGSVEFDGQPLHSVPLSGYSPAEDRHTLIVPPGTHTVRWVLTAHTVPPPEVTGPAALRLRGVSYTPSAAVDPVADALDAPDLPWLIPGEGTDWQRQTDSTTDGVDALRYFPPSTYAFSSLTTVLPGPGRVAVNQRGMRVNESSPTAGWAEAGAASTVPLVPLVRLQVATVYSTFAPFRPAELDQFRYALESVPLVVALDAPDQVWETGAAAPFIGYAGTTSSSAWDQVDAVMASGGTPGAWLQTTVMGPARVSFRLLETGGTFTLNGLSLVTPQTTGWNEVSFETGPGLQVLRWEKTGSAPWAVDNFSTVPLPPGTSLAEALDFPGPWMAGDSSLRMVSLTDSSDGQDAVLSSPYGPGFGVMVTGPGRLQFQAKAPPGVYRYYYYSPFPWLETESGSSWTGPYKAAWTPVVIDTIPPGRQLLRWPGGADGVVGRDQVSFVPYATTTLAAGLDLPGYGILTAPAAPWTAWQAGSAAQDGEDVVISGGTPDSWMDLTLPAGAGELRLMARCPGLRGWGGPRLAIAQGSTMLSWEMPAQWKQIVVPVVAAGPRTLRFSQTGLGDLWLDTVSYVPAAEALNQWLAAHGLGNGTALASDDDRDGTPVLLEYAFGMDASRHGQTDLGVPAGAGLPVFSVYQPSPWQSPQLRCEFLRRTGGTGLRYEVFFSNDPAAPLDEAGQSSSSWIIPLTNDWERVQVTDYNFGNSASRRFGRVRVTLDR